MDFDLLGSLAPRTTGHDAAASGPADSTPHAVCSRRGCRAAARWSLVWNNPRVHTPERRKTWLACDEHREHLADFLGQRGFLKDVEPFEQQPTGGVEPGAQASVPDEVPRETAPEPTEGAGGVGPAGTERLD